MFRLFSAVGNGLGVVRDFATSHYPNVTWLPGLNPLSKALMFFEANGEGIVRLLREAQEFMETQQIKQCQFLLGNKFVLLLAHQEDIADFKSNHENDLKKEIPLLRTFLGDIILNERDDAAKKERILIMKYLHTKELQSQLSSFIACATKHLAQQQSAPTVNFKAIFNNYVIENVATCLYGIKNTQASNQQLVDILVDITQSVFKFSEVFKHEYMPNWLRYVYCIFTGEEYDLNKIRQNMIQRLTKLFEGRTETGYMKELQKFVMDNSIIPAELLLEDESKINLRILFGRLLFLLIAGTATTASAIQFALLLLSKHPDVLQQLRDELQNANMTAESLSQLNNVSEINKLKWLDCIYKEVVRLYPPVPFYLAREADKGFTVGNIPIQPGDIVMAAPWIAQRLSSNYPNPLEFRPGRFLDAKVPLPKPFSMGPRSCPGQNLAELEIKVMLISLVTSYDFTLDQQEKFNAQGDADIELIFNGPISPKSDLKGKLFSLNPVKTQTQVNMPSQPQTSVSTATGSGQAEDRTERRLKK